LHFRFEAAAKLFEAALGISNPWFVAALEFDEAAKTLTVLIDFKAGSRFSVSGHQGAHPAHDTVTKTYRHLDFFQGSFNSAGRGQPTQQAAPRPLHTTGPS